MLRNVLLAEKNTGMKLNHTYHTCPPESQTIILIYTFILMRLLKLKLKLDIKGTKTQDSTTEYKNNMNIFDYYCRCGNPQS